MSNPEPKNRHDDAFLQEYFQICKRIYEKMEREGTWPWTSDSQEFGDVVDSKDK